MDERNKYSLDRERGLLRMARSLRQKLPRQGRIVYRQVMRGAAYSLGSGAVSLVIVWFEARH
ncbi:hypothetical protein [Streptomyces sp. NPDC021562]|uniref:hypothetical protein n=1 Tax=Streptomyces sp. NPDC021562 TaxID=3155121 RepID=UPI0033EFD2E0